MPVVHRSPIAINAVFCTVFIPVLLCLAHSIQAQADKQPIYKQTVKNPLKIINLSVFASASSGSHYDFNLNGIGIEARKLILNFDDYGQADLFYFFCSVQYGSFSKSQEVDGWAAIDAGSHYTLTFQTVSSRIGFNTGSTFNFSVYGGVDYYFNVKLAETIHNSFSGLYTRTKGDVTPYTRRFLPFIGVGLRKPLSSKFFAGVDFERRFDSMLNKLSGQWKVPDRESPFLYDKPRNRWSISVVMHYRI